MRLVSHEAKGVWIDILCLMWTSPERGKLLRPDGKPYSTEQIARSIGYFQCHDDVTLDVTLKELVEANVCDFEKGVYICRRMLRESGKTEGARLRKQRERERSRGNVTQPGGEMSRRLSRDVTLTEAEAETETETETETERGARAVGNIEDLCDRLIAEHDDIHERHRVGLEQQLHACPDEAVRRQAVDDLLLNYTGASFSGRHTPVERLGAYIRRLMPGDRDRGKRGGVAAASNREPWKIRADLKSTKELTQKIWGEYSLGSSNAEKERPEQYARYLKLKKQCAEYEKELESAAKGEKSQ
ncbi:MAG: hypothetical protein EOM20_14685 [Spartobacteria bacterium]|nr:hypothetical protein [Spartobacteria bacterium]